MDIASVHGVDTPYEGAGDTFHELSQDAESGRPWRKPSLRLVLIGVDLLALELVWFVMAVWAAHLPFIDEGLGRNWMLMAGVSFAGSILAFRAQGMYRARVCNLRSVETACIVRATATVVVVMLAMVPFLDVVIHPGGLLIAAGLQIAFVMTGRALYRAWVASHRREGRMVRPVILVGANDEAASLYQLTIDHPEVGLGVCGYVAEPGTPPPAEGLPWLGSPSDVVAIAAQVGADGALIAASAHQPEALNRVVRKLVDAGVHVQVSSGLHGIAAQRLRAQAIAREPVFYVETSGLRPRQLMLKRVLDVSVSAVTLVIAAPVMAITAIAVRLQDGGPVLFRQERVGRDGVPFVMFKFRSMVTNAEAMQAEIDALNERSGPLFKATHDPRVTRVGRLLRATSLDELPQLFNVIRGSMSLVGPRPALASEVEQFDAELRNRTKVLPGVTGLWQIEARDNASFAAYRRLDLFYMENWSIGFDIIILLSTAVAVLMRGIRAPRKVAKPRLAVAATVVRGS